MRVALLGLRWSFSFEQVALGAKNIKRPLLARSKQVGAALATSTGGEVEPMPSPETSRAQSFLRTSASAAGSAEADHERATPTDEAPASKGAAGAALFSEPSEAGGPTPSEGDAGPVAATMLSGASGKSKHLRTSFPVLEESSLVEKQKSEKVVENNREGAASKEKPYIFGDGPEGSLGRADCCAYPVPAPTPVIPPAPTTTTKPPAPLPPGVTSTSTTTPGGCKLKDSGDGMDGPAQLTKLHTIAVIKKPEKKQTAQQGFIDPLNADGKKGCLGGHWGDQMQVQFTITPKMGKILQVTLKHVDVPGANGNLPCGNQASECDQIPNARWTSRHGALGWWVAKGHEERGQPAVLPVKADSGFLGAWKNANSLPEKQGSYRYKPVESFGALPGKAGAYEVYAVAPGGNKADQIHFRPPDPLSGDKFTVVVGENYFDMDPGDNKGGRSCIEIWVCGDGPEGR